MATARKLVSCLGAATLLCFVYSKWLWRPHWLVYNGLVVILVGWRSGAKSCLHVAWSLWQRLPLAAVCCGVAVVLLFLGVTRDFNNKIRYALYMSSENKISHKATNKGNINRQCSIYNVFSIKNITLDSKQRKDNSDLQVKTPIHRDN